MRYTLLLASALLVAAPVCSVLADEDPAVDPRHTWDLTELYPSVAAWNEAREEVLANLTEREPEHDRDNAARGEKARRDALKAHETQREQDADRGYRPAHDELQETLVRAQSLAAMDDPCGYPTGELRCDEKD